MTRFFLLALASLGFIGCIPHKLPFKKWKGAGLLGSLAAWGLLWLLPPSGPAPWIAALIALAVSIPVSTYAENQWTYDDPRIVIDELVGVWIACLAVPRQMGPMLAGLVLFRVFDVWKGPWGRAGARLPAGLGVVADDVLAALIASAILQLLLHLSLFTL
jgi:phosphatidylglycerophosphatase A